MSSQPPEPSVRVHLEAASQGDARAAAELLPLLYDELRKLAADRMRRIAPGQTLQPTALVHEAYLRLTAGGDPGWNGRRHFFGAAARAMRDILVEQARRKAAAKRGGNLRRADVGEVEIPLEPPREDLEALEEALQRLEVHDAAKAEIVMLRYFAGLSTSETASTLGVSERTIEREWRYIKAWLRREIDGRSRGRSHG